MVNKDSFWDQDRSDCLSGDDSEQKVLLQDDITKEVSCPSAKMDLDPSYIEAVNKVRDDAARGHDTSPGAATCTLSSTGKICFAILIIFLASWCFYMGFAASNVFASQNSEYLDADALNGGDLTDLGISGIKTVLLMGCDKRAEGPNSSDVGRSDTIMLVFLNTENKSATLLSIPRDTYVQIPSSGEMTKINHAYAYGGVPLTENTIESFLGIKIDNYVKIDFQGFADVVEALGGVTMDVEMRMYTPWENIDLQEGKQKLNGEDALAYVRYREKLYGDTGRVDRQQKFISVLADDIFSSKNLLKLPKVIDLIMNEVETDLSNGEMMSMAKFMQVVGVSNMETFKLDGEAIMLNGISYWKVDESQIPTIVEHLTAEGKGNMTTDNSAESIINNSN
ncbi:MAG: LCP family protein [Bacillota bacterium]|jgi:LCP family protein required for cell wall assembly